MLLTGTSSETVSDFLVRLQKWIEANNRIEETDTRLNSAWDRSNSIRKRIFLLRLYWRWPIPPCMRTRGHSVRAAPAADGKHGAVEILLKIRSLLP